MKYAWIRKHANDYPISRMLKALNVSSSGYYDWLERKPSSQKCRRDAIARVAEQFYWRSFGIYGYRKVHEDILDEAPDLCCCQETVRKVLGELGLVSRVKRRYVATTDSAHSHPVAENVLQRDFEANGPDEKWAADITYIATEEGWLYLAIVIDLWSRRIVGWSMSRNIDSQLVKDALASAVERRHPGEGLLHHSDRGVQYASDAFQGCLAKYQISCSMSRKGNCWDNAPAESFFGKLKSEWVRGRVYKNHSEARQSIFEYIEVFYNRIRRHAALGYVSPEAFEACAKNKVAA